jgi:eukaryotic-like serine/threonine-protein kinase
MMTDIASATRLRCPDCLAVFRTAFTFCPADGATLIQCVEEPLLGATVADRYVLEELIGEGAMGLVYRASHVRLPRQFAIKVLFGDMASDARMRLRFAQEASAACRLNHPNVVTVVDFGKSERGLLYLVMDYVEGETLCQLIEREAPLDERQVIELSLQLCDGLAHAHANGIVHRDFKPDNVVLEPREGARAVPRILDFGLAITSNDDLFDGRLTQHGWVVGTPTYLSPEQARDEAVDQRSDLYSLGVVMYEMLAGVPPFDGNAMEVAHRNMVEPPPLIRARNPLACVSAELERVVRRLLEKNPDDRFATAEEVIAALEHIDETYDYGISAGMAALVLGDEPEPIAQRAPVTLVVDSDGLAEPFVPFEELRPGRLRRAAFALSGLMAIAGLIYFLTGGGATFGAEVAARTVEPASTASVALPDQPSAPAEAPAVTAPAAPAVDSPAAPSAPSVQAPSTAAPMAKKAEPIVRRTPHRAVPARTSKAARAPQRRPVLRSAAPPVRKAPPLMAQPDGGIADPDTPAHLAAATSAPAPQPGPDASVSRLIAEYRQVGQAIARLQGQADPDVASGFRDRYFQLPYADALRIPAVRRDTLAQLARLRRDLAAASRPE